MSYLHGIRLSDIISGTARGFDHEKVMKEVGREFSSLHSYGICLGDSKPQNIIISSREKVSFTDLEQASCEGDQAWDLSLLLFYGAKFSLDKIKILNSAKAFLEGYVEQGDRKVVVKTASDRYIRVFLPLVHPDILTSLKELCKSYGKEML